MAHIAYLRMSNTRRKKDDRLLDNGGKIDVAMKNAYKLLENSKDLSYSDKWPATNVVEFFEEYKDYIE